LPALDGEIGESCGEGAMLTSRAREENEAVGSRATNVSHARTSPDPPSALILGFGNILLGDDGAGVQLVERLRTELPDGAYEFVDGGTMSFSLLSHVEENHTMLVIDAAELGEPAGSTMLFENEDMDRFLKSARRRTVHEVGLVDLLDMARLRNCLPRRRALLCIQPALIDWSETLSAPVGAALAQASAQARALLARWCVA
jgi:hydrogenase maturation protease